MASSAKFCTNCGNPIPHPNSLFCSQCGSKVGVVAQDDRIITARGAQPNVADVPVVPRVKFFRAIELGFQNYLNFRGRSTRAEFWWWILFTRLGLLIAFVVDNLLIADGILVPIFADGSGIIWFIFDLVTIIPTCAVAVRRYHDINKSIYELLTFPIGLVFMVGLNRLGILDTSVVAWQFVIVLNLFLLTFRLAKNGDVGTNKYGPDPKLK